MHAAASDASKDAGDDGGKPDLIDPNETSLGVEWNLGTLARRAPWVLLCVVLVAAASYAYSKHQPKKYTATAAVSFSSNPLSQQIAGLSSSTSSSSLTAQQATNLELVRLGDMSGGTARLLDHGLTTQKVSQSLTVTPEGESGVVAVAATSKSPILAAAIANTYVRLFVQEQQAANRKFYETALVLVQKQLGQLPPAERFGADGLGLETRTQTLKLLSELGYDNVQVAQNAVVPSGASSPKTRRNTILGAVLGLVLGLATAFILERLDRRIREPDELEEIYRSPMLGVVRNSSALSQSESRARGPGAALPLAEAEAFSLIRAHLRFFNVDREVRTIVIASPASGDGKTTIGRYLAEAAARSGVRALLMEFDLRQPTLAQAFDIEPGPGVAGVLIGAVTLDEATKAVALRTAPGEGSVGHTLDVLLAGAVLPPNPAELLESRAAVELLAQARSAYEVIVIDTPPLTTVSDGFPLLTKVDGVVLVGRVGYSRRDAARRLHRVLASSDAPVLGVVANGSNSGGPSPYPTRVGSSTPLESTSAETLSEAPASPAGL